MKRKLKAFCDGLCEPRNPGSVATWGIAVFEAECKIYESSGVIGEGQGMTNNVAEYQGLLHLLDWANQLVNDAEVQVFTDSQLLANQINGVWLVHSPRIQPLYTQAQTKIKALQKRNVLFSINWTSREDNKEADLLSVAAYVTYCEKERALRAREIKNIEPAEDGKFKITGKTGSVYLCSTDPPNCTCEDFKRHYSERFPIRCKHILAVVERKGSEGEFGNANCAGN